MADLALDGNRVLVMEDEFLIALDVEQVCLDHGAREVVIVRSLEEADRDRLDPTAFDAAVVDVMLGGRSTLDFARALMERNIPFVFATGYSDAEALFDGFREVPVVPKPFAGTDLVEQLAAAISRSQASSCV